MDKRIHKLFSQDILKEAASRFDADIDSLKELGGFESYIYEYGPEENRKILRITHSYHRSMDDLGAEMEWVEYLDKNGGDVAGTVRSADGLLAEKIDMEDSYFIASSVKKAPGGSPGKSGWNARLFKAWGKAVGKLHRLTKGYEPVGLPRFHWDEEYLLKDYKMYIPDDQHDVIEKAGGIISKIKGYEKSIDSYGLIHTDVHQGNFFVDEDKVTIFDFDDCAYKHFISDIAIAVFYSMMAPGRFDSPEDFAEYFLGHFMDGYSVENTLAAKWLKTLPDFLKLREIILYVAICRSIDPSEPDKWCLDYINKHRSTIENGVPVLKREII